MANDGGPAFPGEYDNVFVDQSGQQKPFTLTARQKGMSLRDYFAAHALMSFAGETRGVVVAINNERTTGDDYGMAEREARNCAEAAYALADAMLKAREEQ